MPKKLDFQLSEIELLQVTEAIRKDKRPEMGHPAAAIQLLALSQRPVEVAESLAVRPATVYSWFWSYPKGPVCINKLHPDMAEFVEAVDDQSERQNVCQRLDRFSLLKFMQ